MKLLQVRLLVKNFRESFRFYRDLLGFPTGWYDEQIEYALFTIEFLNQPADRHEWGARISHFRDPDGNLIEIYKML